MSSEQDSAVDVVVIGGGPAGAAAARCLASWGHRVMLLMRGATGLANAESVPASCLGLFDRIGIRDAIEAAGFMRATGNTVWWSGAAEPARVLRFGAESMGFQVDRHVFDQLLLREAAAAGAIVRRHAVVGDVFRASDGEALTRVRVMEGSRTHDVTARWVLDCTGRVGLLARRGWRLPANGTRTIGLIGEWDVRSGWGLDDTSHTLVESYERGWAWSVPSSTRRRCFVVMVDPAVVSLKGRRQLETEYHKGLARTTHLKRFVERATLAGPPWARNAAAYTAARVSDDGLLLVGDAASFVDPLSSFGVKKALASAWLAAVVVHSCLRDREMLPHALDLYERRERSTYERLTERSAELAREAASGRATTLSNARAMADTEDGDEDADMLALRHDPSVLSADEELRRPHALRIRRAAGVHEAMRPCVRKNAVALEKHLVGAAFPDGLRFIQHVDVCVLADLAPGHERVAAMHQAYNVAAAPVSLSEVVVALSILVGKGLLSLGRAERGSVFSV